MTKTYCDICGDEMEPVPDPAERIKVDKLLCRASDICLTCRERINKIDWDGVVRRTVIGFRHVSGEPDREWLDVKTVNL